jgi:lipoprotein NlpI
LSEGNKDDAISLFDHAANLCFNSVDERTAAALELKALGQAQ